MPSIVTVEVPVRDEKYGFRTVYLAYLHWNPNEASGGYMEGFRSPRTTKVLLLGPRGQMEC